ncbi:hypothetical protein PM082_021285 [Marasmius tenuissimus]|nr:hypothetical protein PM082_021285 [Marasmius tenuissimus]
MANHGYIPRDGHGLTFFTIVNGLRECFGLSTLLAIASTLVGFFLMGRSPIRLPFTVPDWFAIRNPDGSTSQPGVFNLKRDRSSLHHEGLFEGNSDVGSNYPSYSLKIRRAWVGYLVRDLLSPVGETVRDVFNPLEDVVSASSCSWHTKDAEEGEEDEAPSILSRLETIAETSSWDDHSSAIISRPEGSTRLLKTGDDTEEVWKLFATREYEDTLVSTDDVGRMSAMRKQALEGEVAPALPRDIESWEMAIILGVWERVVVKENGKEKKGIPLPYLLTWLAEERLPAGWKPDHVQGLWDVVARSQAIQRKVEAISHSQI